MVKELRLALTVDDFDAGARVLPRHARARDAGHVGRRRIAGVLLDAGRATLELFDEGQAAMVDDIEVGRRVAGTVRIAFEVDDSRASRSGSSTPERG